MIFSHFEFQELINIQVKFFCILQKMAIIFPRDARHESGSSLNSVLNKFRWSNIFRNISWNKNTRLIDIVEPQFYIPFCIEVFNPIASFLEEQRFLCRAYYKFPIGVVGYKRVNDWLGEHVEIEEGWSIAFQFVLLGRVILSALVVLLGKHFLLHDPVWKNNQRSIEFPLSAQWRNDGYQWERNLNSSNIVFGLFDFYFCNSIGRLALFSNIENQEFYEFFIVIENFLYRWILTFHIVIES